MTIASEITRINNNIAAAYTAANNKGASLPNTQNSANLAECINSISAGSGGNNSAAYIVLNHISGSSPEFFLLQGNVSTYNVNLVIPPKIKGSKKNGYGDYADVYYWQLNIGENYTLFYDHGAGGKIKMASVNINSDTFVSFSQSGADGAD